jgi:hypothetical protein
MSFLKTRKLAVKSTFYYFHLNTKHCHKQGQQFNNENPPAGMVLPAASNSSSTVDMAAVVVDGLAVVVGALVFDTALLLAAVVVDGLAVLFVQKDYDLHSSTESFDR